MLDPNVIRPSDHQAVLDHGTRLMLGDGAPEEYGVEQAARRPDVQPTTSGDIVKQRTLQQMGVDAADNENRRAVGLSPRYTK